MQLGREILYLSRADVAGLGIVPADEIAAIEQLMRAKAAGRTKGPPKLSIEMPDGRLFQTMIAHAEAPAYGAIKNVGLAPDNEARHLPHLHALILLQDHASGMPVAIMDGTWITETRTAAISALAAKHLARADASRIGFVACGAQARSHLDALRAVRPVTSLRAYSRRKATAEAFAAEARSQGLDSLAVERPEDAVRGCDIVVTTVPRSVGLKPFLDVGWVDDGSFVACVDLARAWDKAGLARFDKVATDDRDQAEIQAKAGKLAYPGPFHADLAELVTGTRPGRADARERIAFIFPGFALADLAVATLVYERAMAQRRGATLPL
ncbi:MAG: ornithine cyclodeaminase family protein [Alphaproteobacteria bacterium]|nr:ornithine cyclodeaminase family protein [Alphaproteobacteria bacterium]